MAAVIEAKSSLEALQSVPSEHYGIYILVFAVSFLASLIGSYLGAYFKRKAENLATKEDFEDLLGQVKKSTELTEQIKLDLSHKDWATREWKLTRRIKLECFMKCLGEVSNWLLNYRFARLSGGEPEKEDSPLKEARMLAILYFPEFEVLVRKCWEVDIMYREKVLEVKVGDLAIADAEPELKRYLDSLAKYQVELENKARDICKEIIAI